jgi:hypothetical protein
MSAWTPISAWSIWSITPEPRRFFDIFLSVLLAPFGYSGAESGVIAVLCKPGAVFRLKNGNHRLNLFLVALS